MGVAYARTDPWLPPPGAHAGVTCSSMRERPRQSKCPTWIVTVSWDMPRTPSGLAVRSGALSSTTGSRSAWAPSRGGAAFADEWHGRHPTFSSTSHAADEHLIAPEPSRRILAIIGCSKTNRVTIPEGETVTHSPVSIAPE